MRRIKFLIKSGLFRPRNFILISSAIKVLICSRLRVYLLRLFKSSCIEAKIRKMIILAQLHLIIQASFQVLLSPFQILLETATVFLEASGTTRL